MIAIKHYKSQKHSFHIVDPSPWPILTALSLFSLALGATLYLHRYQFGGFLFLFSFIILILTLSGWWRDVIRESTFSGYHTLSVQSGIRYAMLIFILSEAFLFVGLFWGFFHCSLIPDMSIGGVFPPQGIDPIDPWGIPFLNTLILLTSGATLTWSHHSILTNYKKEAIYSLFLTIVLAIIFTGFQAYEYVEASFNINDSIYGSLFYLITGFHGMHVIVGTVFLIICLIRMIKNHFLTDQHINFEVASWYWHFVDVVWILVFISIYWWGNKDLSSGLFDPAIFGL